MAGRKKTTIAVQITGDVRDFMRATRQAETSAQKLQRNLDGFSKSAMRNVALPLAAAGAAAVKLFNQQEKAEAQLESTFKSMSAAAWTSTKALKDHASAIQENSTFGDEAIIHMQSLLLTFGNIKDAAGENNDIFARTTQVAADLAATGLTNLQGAAVMLGKALNDPVANLSALSRSGIQFNDEQKNLIKTLWASGQQMEAQKVILEELERQFGGTAEAIAETAGGKMQQALNALGDAAEQVGAVLAPMITELADAVSEAAVSFQGLDESAQKNIVKGAMGTVAVVVLSRVASVLWGIGQKAAPAAMFAFRGLRLAAAGLGAVFGVSGAAATAFAGAIAAVAYESNRVATEARKANPELERTVSILEHGGQPTLVAIGLMERFGNALGFVGTNLRDAWAAYGPYIDAEREAAHQQPDVQRGLQATTDRYTALANYINKHGVPSWIASKDAAEEASSAVAEAAKAMQEKVAARVLGLVESIGLIPSIFDTTKELSVRSLDDFVADVAGRFKFMAGLRSLVQQGLTETAAAFADQGYSSEALNNLDKTLLDPMRFAYEDAMREAREGAEEEAAKFDQSQRAMEAFKARWKAMGEESKWAWYGGWNDTQVNLSIPSVQWSGGGTVFTKQPFMFHEGGVVPGPVGMERLAVVQAGETVIPYDKSPAMSGSGTYNFHFNGPVMDRQEAARWVEEAMERARRS